MEKNNPLHTFVNIKEGKCIVLDGIMNVLRFDERGVSLLSSVGRIEIEGEGLKIESLTKDDGEILVTGKIEGVFYSKEKSSESFLKRIFG